MARASLADCHDAVPEEGEVDPDPAGHVEIPTPGCILLMDDEEEEEVPLVRRRGGRSLEAGDATGSEAASAGQEVP